jgi:dephospho-CoA kinase
VEQADSLAEPLAEAGFPKNSERCHNSADPGRLANVHLQVEGSKDWRDALLFRDWLRAVEGERADYLTLKEEIARRFASAEDVTEAATAKDAWFDIALPRAETWATQTHWEP